MSQQIPVDAHAAVQSPHTDDGTNQIAPDLAYKRLAIVNVVFYGAPNAGDRNWVLIDTGVMGTTGLIESAAAERFGENARPAAIIQTHGHFNHIGALEESSKKWDAPVFAHELEVPYLNGSAAYPPPDPGVGGMMSLLSLLYLHGPPMYFTQNWQDSKSSVERLAALEPEVAITGHGPALHGSEMRRALSTLAHDFDLIAVPEHGKYLDHPTRADDGSAYEPVRNS